MDFQPFILLLIFTVISGQRLDVQPPTSRLFLVNGSTQELSCSLKPDSGSGELKWEKPGTAVVTEKMGETQTLQFREFDSDRDSGNYTCVVEQNGEKKNSFTITVIGVKETKNHPKFEFDKPLEPLICDFNFSHVGIDIKSSPEWYQGDKKVSSLKDVRFKESSENLTIKEPKRTDAGIYYAKYNITSRDKEYTYTCEVSVTADPFVLSFDKSKNLIQEEDLELQCKVLGFPKSVVTWYKDGLKLNESRAVMSTLDGHKNGRLVIENVDFPDAGDYNCTAHSTSLMTSDSKVIVVRVKDKLAALWPFLGIVAEVFVLCFIIFIYEKRRNKQAQQAENDAQELDQTEQKGNVRNRRNQK